MMTVIATGITGILGTASLLINIAIAYPRWRAEHRFRQESRLKWDGYTPPWWMAWTYWIGIEHIVFRSKLHTEECMAAYLSGFGESNDREGNQLS